MKFDADIKIKLKPGVMDAEGETVAKSLKLLGYPVDKVASVKVYKVTVDAKTKEEAKKLLDDACKKLLANPVIQDYSIYF